MQVPFFFVLDQLTCAELQNTMTPHQVWYYEKTRNTVFSPTHEILFGLYYATKMDGPVKKNEFGTFEDMEKAYKDGKIEFDDLVFCDDKQTTYGRSKVEKIIDRSLDSIIGEGVPVSSGNIGKVVAAIDNDRDRAQKISKLNIFASEIITHQGMDTPPFDKIYNFNDPEVKKLIESDEPLSVRYNKLNDYIKKQVKTTIDNLPDDNIANMLKGSGRVKMDSIYNIYCPVVYPDGTVSNSNLFQGYTERDFVTKGISNRQVQQLKKDGVPIGGYVTRQMVLAQMDVKFVDKDESPDKVGLRIPRSEAIGRTTLDGRKIRTATPGSKETVVVKSCINHNDNIVYADEIDQEHLHEKDGSSIGISFSMSFTEDKTQSILALKHADVTKTYEDAKIIAQHSGIVDVIDGGYLIIRTDDGTIDKYLLSGRISLSRQATVGNHVTAGDLLAQSRRLSQLQDQIADLCDFLGLQNSSAKEGLGREEGRGRVLCYAPVSGTIKYPTPYVIEIGGVEIPVNDREVYFYPEGYKVEKGERFCSGLLDLHAFYLKNPRTQDTFDAMKKQLAEIQAKKLFLRGDEWSSSSRSEVLELLYRSIASFAFSARKKYTQTGNFLERMSYGDGKKGLANFLKKADNNVIEIQDSVILPLVLGLEA